MTTAPLARHTINGTTFLSCARTAAHLSWTVAELKKLYPFARLHIIQPCYNSGVAASAGTHDKDAVFDVQIIGMGWWDAQLFLRRCGWAAWFRHTGLWADERNWHIHMVSIPEGLSNTPTPEDIGKAYQRLGIEVGIYIDGGYTTQGRVTTSSQVDDYFDHSIGLKGQHRAGADKSRFPRNIAATIYRYQEDDLMAFSDWSDAEKKAFGTFIQDNVRATLIDADTNGDGKTEPTHLGAIVRDLVADINALEKKIGA